MQNNAKRLTTAAGSAILVAGMLAPMVASAAPAGAPVQSDLVPAGRQVAADAAVVHAGAARVAEVQGTFSFTQTDVTPNAAIARNLYGASHVLCGATDVETAAVATIEDAQAWQISVGGDVENAFTASVGDLAQSGAAQTIMGCTCVGNPADGLASVNAQVTGVTLRSIIEAAAPVEGANTITFTSADGYSVSLPLSYVEQRYALVVYGIGDQAMYEVAGCANRLWLGSTAARYFSQDVVAIEITAEDEADVPPAPGTPEAADRYANVPNVSVVGGVVG